MISFRFWIASEDIGFFEKYLQTEYGYNFCVNCSDVESVVGVTTVEGSGDHTYNDIIIMDQDRARSIAQKEAELSGKKVHIEMLDLDADESAVSQSVKESVINVLNDEEEEEYDSFDPNKDQEGIEGIDY